MRLGVFEVVSPLGSGGMGEVWKARDTNLHREVALKILPDAVALDHGRMARFRREAQVLASLNHPHIGAIYGFEESGGIQALVLELVEGPTLADRIAQGAIPLDESLRIAAQIAEALEAAHEQGIIHRDLKPANIKLRPDGPVKVLDFGLAKAHEPASGEVTASPTITSPALMTGAGVLLGTAAYMSPEQARGKPADKRCDIWAFGCVLFEMLTAQRAFGGDDVMDVVVAVMTKEPDWSALPPALPTRVATLLRRCLRKDARERLKDIGDARLEISEPFLPGSTPPSGSQAVAPSRAHSWRGIALVAVVSALAGGLGVWRVMSGVKPTSGPVVRFAMELSPGDQLAATNSRVVAVSPDGRYVVYVANQRMYLRSMDQPDASEINGTSGGTSVHGRNPFFSPDGRWIGFWHNGALKKVAVTGGVPVTICATAVVPYGATWTADDEILFGLGSGGIARVAVSGGEPQTVVRVENGQMAGWPEVLPDRKTVLFTLVTGIWDNAQIAVQSLATGRRQVLFQGTDARYVSSGHLVYGLRGALYAVPFNLQQLNVVNRPAVVVQNVAVNTTTSGVMQASLSANGTLVYTSTASEQRRLSWVDRSGRSEPIPAEPRAYTYPRLSPDGQKIAVSATAPTPDIWVYDIPRGVQTRITLDGNNTRSVWTPDGKRLAYASDRAGGPPNIYWIDANGSAPPERLTTSPNQQVPEGWAPDGKTLAFSEFTPETNWDIWMLDFPPRKPRVFLRTPVHDGGRAFSPDGRWFAYYSDESGRGEVYVRSYPGPGDKWLISTGGGAEPVWSRNGRELFYRSGKRLMAVDVTLQPSFAAGRPRVLFEGPYVSALPANFDVSLDGQRFVMLEPERPDARPPSLGIVLNAFEELARVAPATGR